jgi:NAD(P)H dehydrogenase (quinone)
VKVVLIVAGDDDLLTETARLAASSAGTAGHDVVVLDLPADGFSPWMSPDDRAAYHEAEPLVDPLAAKYAELIRGAEVIAFVDRAQLSTVSPMLKGWLEKVLVPGVAFYLDERTHRVKRGLTSVKRLVGISIGDGQGRSGRNTLMRAFRMCTGFRTRPTWIELRPGGDTAEFHRRVATRMAGL